MATGTKKNFRCADDAVWERALTKAEQMRRQGFDIDMTAVLNAAVRQFASEHEAETVQRFGLVRSDAPVPLYRRPVARTAAEQ